MEKNDVKGNNVNPVSKNKSGVSWKGVSLGGFPGILLGVGAIAGAQVFAKKVPIANISGEKNDAAETATAAAPSPEVKEEKELTFEEAFNEAREAMGPDGVFEWHGGMYSTHTREEMEAMTPEEQENVVENSGVAVPAREIGTLPTDDNPDVMNVNNGAAGESAGGDAFASNLESGSDDVHVVGVSEYEGHSMAQVDIDNDGYSDVSIVDMDDDGQLSGVDIIIDNEGNSGTYAELSSDSNGSAVEGENVDYASNDDSSTYDNTDDLAASGDDSFLDNPDVAEDMPDYMNDAIV